MDAFPIQILLVPLIGLAAVIYFFVTRNKRVANYDQQYSNYRASALAQRLGLAQVSGNPDFNLFISQADAGVMNGPTDKKAVDVDVRLQGCPNGINLELIYVYNVTQNTGFSTVTRNYYFDCRMIAHCRTPFPPFEVVTRPGASAAGAIAQTLPYPPMPTGNPAVDASYLVVTQEPGMAQVLGTLLSSFGQFLQVGMHLVGDGKTISYVMKKDKPPLVASTLYYAEQMASNLTQMAKTIGG